MSSARELITAAARELSDAGVASPRVDAELLLADVLGSTRTSATLRLHVDAAQAAAYAALVARRAAREPLQHILGTAPFRHVVPAVGPGVFIPRPETELLVDAVLSHLRPVPDPIAVDLCSGSGAVALAVADEVPGARVIAVEYASPALAWLVRNALGTRVEVHAGDIRDPGLLPGLRGRVDAVLCNPPYVPSGTEVDTEVRADPPDAVFAGPEGIELMPSVIDRAGELLRPDGVLALEHAESHGERVLDLLRATGHWSELRDRHDLSGRPRFVTARRVGAPRTAD